MHSFSLLATDKKFFVLVNYWMSLEVDIFKQTWPTILVIKKIIFGKFIQEIFKGIKRLIQYFSICFQKAP